MKRKTLEQIAATKKRIEIRELISPALRSAWSAHIEELHRAKVEFEKALYNLTEEQALNLLTRHLKELKAQIKARNKAA